MTHATAKTLPDPQPRRCFINGAENLWTGTAWHPRRALEARFHYLQDLAVRADRVGAKQSAALYRSDANHIRHLLNEANAMTPRIKDNDRDEITAEINGREVRGWSYASEQERRVKMLMAKEFAEGWFQATKADQSEVA